MKNLFRIVVQFRRYLFCLLTGVLLFPCPKNNSPEKLLIQAQDSLIIDKPDITLNLLASIQNPERMDKEMYIKYIVSYVGAKKETKADIYMNRLIFEAQSYLGSRQL